MKNSKNSGFTIVELLVAMGISAIVITSAIGTVGQIYFSQKKVLVSQDFYAESRFLMERLVQVARNNTIDYDRYFLEIGPDPAGCSNFEANQLPVETPTNNDQENREELGYATIFYWDTNADGEPDRNLGGVDLDGNIDPCGQAWYEKRKILRLINGSRTLQTAVRKTDLPEGDANENKIEIERRLGADTDNDGKTDQWSAYTNWDGGNSVCNIYWDEEKTNLIGESRGVSDRDGCMRAHPWTIISPDALIITRLIFEPSPDRDPFLNFRNDVAQVHPHVFISLQTKLKNPQNFGFEVGREPVLSMQTSASSRVFGDPRK